MKINDTYNTRNLSLAMSTKSSVSNLNPEMGVPHSRTCYFSLVPPSWYVAFISTGVRSLRFTQLNLNSRIFFLQASRLIISTRKRPASASGIVYGAEPPKSLATRRHGESYGVGTWRNLARVARVQKASFLKNSIATLK